MNIQFPEYDYPGVAYDFSSNQELTFENYRELENLISKQLKSTDLIQVKDGLSNVLYWGHYRAGYRNIRVTIFRESVTEGQLSEFCKLSNDESISPLSIKDIRMPQFSGFAFISKIMMFHDPSNYVTLDKKIMELRDPNNPNSPLTNIIFGQNETSIRITQNSQTEYYRWCELCKSLASKFNGKLAADIERGFFKYVELGKANIGREIIYKLTNNVS